MQKGGQPKPIRKAQSRRMPGLEEKMKPRPVSITPQPTKKLEGKVALITGGDSGIGRAVALLFAQEGANIAISYLREQSDAESVKQTIEEEFSQQCLLIPGDIKKEKHCEKIVAQTIKSFGRLDI